MAEAAATGAETEPGVDVRLLPAATRLALAGCTEAEIATITGHSLRWAQPA